MKRMLSSVIIAVFIVGTGSCFAATPAVAPTTTPATTATEGLKSIIMSPLQVSDNVKTEMHAAKFMPFGVVGGAAKGTFYMGKQIIDGVWSIVTIPYHMVVK